MRTMSLRDDSPTEVLTREFGRLEVQALEAIWNGPRPATVRDLQPFFPGCAYTTLMTTMDRLHKKGVLQRVKVGRAFAYEPRVTRAELELQIAAESIEGILGAGRGRSALAPVLSCFINAVTERDRLLLDDLERLLKEKRSQLGREDSR